MSDRFAAYARREYWGVQWLARARFHEAGHSVVEHVCGLRVRSIHVRPDGSGMVIVHPMPLDVSPSYDARLQAVRIAGLMAGEVAEEIVFGSRADRGAESSD